MNKMKRRTKKVIFMTAMTITFFTLLATAGRHHCLADRYGCGQHGIWYDQHEKSNDHLPNADKAEQASDGQIHH